MRGIEPQLKDAGATLVVVGNGKPRYARAFKDEQGITFPLFVDPEMNAYRAAGLKRGLWQTLGPQVLPKGLAAIFRGFRQGPTQGDPWQQGGVFIIAPGGRMKFRHVNKHAADHVSPARLLTALA